MLLPPLFPQPAPPVTAASIRAAASVGNLARPQGFRLGQSSSRDPRSARPGTPDWWANEDWGHYLREESNAGRREWVLADLRGPGAIVRQWTANPVGTWRYYFDGETTPRLTTTAKEIAAGRWLGLGEPDAYVASRGCNLYFPLPYAKSLKVTVDASDGDPKAMYYVLGHRAYPAQTPVRSLGSDELKAAAGPAIPPLPSRLDLDSDGAVPMRAAQLAPGATRELLASDRAGMIESILLTVQSLSPPPNATRTDPRRRRNVLRTVVFEADFDGEPCLRVPVADLFGAPPGTAPYATAVSAEDGKGLMRLGLPMPFHRAARVRLRNVGQTAVTARWTVAVSHAAPPPDALLLHAQFRRHPGPSRPTRDLPVAHLRGRGHYVGTVLHVANPSRAWWGEGDEKVRVDGEATPGIWGTGTEDYFGYAWSSNLPFSRPYHAQPGADSDGNSGQIANVRWHVLDPIPYATSLDFDLELWHWTETKSAFATTAFWYAAPGGTPATPLRAADLTVPDGAPPGPEPGALQGEALEIAARTGGATELQSGFSDLPDAQLWWKDAAVGDRLDLRLPPVAAGRYRVEIRACFARDYGRHALSLGGTPLGTRDFYSPTLGWKRLTLGIVTLPAGRPLLSVAAERPNPKAEPRRMFALDWIKLIPIR